MRLSTWMKQAYKVEDALFSREGVGSIVVVDPGKAKMPDVSRDNHDVSRDNARGALLDEDNPCRWVGFIDRVAPDVIHGWAYDTQHPEGSVTVEAVTENGKRSVTLANLPREDVANAGHGTGRYGFVLDLIKLGLKTETLVVRFADSKHPISHEPIDFNAQHALLNQTMPPSFFDNMLFLASQIRMAAETKTITDLVR